MAEDSSKSEHQKLEAMLNENLALAKENHEIMRKMKRNSTIALVLQVSWYAVLIGVPVILYWFLLEPIVGTDSSIIDEVEDGYGLQQ